MKVEQCLNQAQEPLIPSIDPVTAQWTRESSNCNMFVPIQVKDEAELNMTDNVLKIGPRQGKCVSRSI